VILTGINNTNVDKLTIRTLGVLKIGSTLLFLGFILAYLGPMSSAYRISLPNIIFNKYEDYMVLGLGIMFLGILLIIRHVIKTRKNVAKINQGN
jgi:uncharacterized membrane protein